MSRPCDTVNSCPAISSVPARSAPVFAAILNVTVPAPAPDAPLVTVKKADWLTAVQPHPAPAATETDNVVGPDETVADDADNE